MKIRVLLTAPAILLLSWSGCPRAAKKANPQAPPLFHTEVVVNYDEIDAASKIPEPFGLGNGAFGLSPDGSELATYVQAGSRIGHPLFVELIRAADSRFLGKLNLGPMPLATLPESFRIAFSGDGKYLLVSDWKAVHVLEASNLSEVRTITAPAGSGFTTPRGMVVASDADVAAIAFGKGACLGPRLMFANGNQYQNAYPCDLEASLVGENGSQQAATISTYWGSQTKRHVRVMVVDFATGKELGSWEADDYPMSISPDGKYVTVSDHAQEGPVLGVDLLDARTGTQICFIGDTDAQRKATAGNKVYGRLVAKFIGNDELVVTGEGNLPNGHYAVDYVRIVQFKPSGGFRIVQEFRPELFGPVDLGDGAFEVSGDGSTFMIQSDHWPPKYFKHEHLPPPPNQALFVFLRQPDGLFELHFQPKLCSGELSRNGAVMLCGRTLLTRK